MEVWKNITNVVKCYEISNLGRLRSLQKGYEGRILKFSKDKKGYLVCRLEINGKKKTVKIHRLVAISFVPNPEHKPQVNHKDGDKTNNNCTNLEWVTNEENIRHAVENGLRGTRYGNECNRSKIDEKHVMKIFESALSIPELAKLYGVTNTSIRCIKNGKSWNHLTKKEFNPKKRTLKREEVLAIFNSTESISELSKKHKIGEIHIKRIKKGLVRSDITGAVKNRIFNKNTAILGEN